MSNNTTSYKDSPLGKIPADWEVKTLGEVAKVTAGGTPSREKKAYWGGNIPWITTSLIDFNEIESAEQFITEEGLKNSSTKLLPVGTLLLALYGQGVTRGKTAVLKIEATINQACAAIILDEKRTNVSYVFQYLMSKYKDIRNLSNTGSQENLSGELVKSIKLRLPPLPEQRAIATCLSTIDKTITKTNQLIAQKELRKKWLMQQLLSGKKRLNLDSPDSVIKGLGIAGKSSQSINPENQGADNVKRLKGYGGEWKEILLKDCFQFIKSYSISREGLSKDQGNQYCIHYGDIHAFYETEFLDFGTQKLIPRLIDEKINIQEKDYLKEGDVIMADASEDYQGVGESIVVLNIENKIAVGGLHTIVLRDFTGITSADFRAYLFAGEKVRNELRKKATGTSVYSVTKTTLGSLVLNLPTIEEQTAIAQVLQVADKEIQLLKAKAAKLKEEKKGMMQVLLTGKKRLHLDFPDSGIEGLGDAGNSIKTKKNQEIL